MRHALLTVLCCLGLALPAAAQEAAKPTGHWEGAIDVKGSPLGIRLDFTESGGAWSATIDIPVQGMRGYALGGVSVAGDQVAFKIPNIPGDPTFAGTLAQDGASLAGSFTQGGQTFPFKVARAEKNADEAATPAAGVPGEGFAGTWQGALEAEGFRLRLAFELADGEGGLGGVVDSIDQQVKIPISKAAANGRGLHIELATVGATFDGTMNDDGSEIAGEWMQGGKSLPLVVKRR
jgi:hypothetical protein